MTFRNKRSHADHEESWSSIWQGLKPRRFREWLLFIVPIIIVLGAILPGFALSETTGNRADWNGGRLVLTTEVGRGTTGGTCTIRPRSGAVRKVRVPDSGRSGPMGRAIVKPWFSGPARVTCPGDQDAMTGWRANVAVVVTSFVYEIGGILLGTLLFAYGYVNVRNRRRDDQTPAPANAPQPSATPPQWRGHF